MIDFKKYIPTSQNTITFIVLMVLVLLLTYQCDRNSTLKQDAENAQKVATRNYNNLKASQDTIKFERYDCLISINCFESRNFPESTTG